MISIGCAISKLLESHFTQYKFNRYLKVEYINTNQEYEREGYSLLVLDKNKEGMYSGVSYRSENVFDSVAQQTRSHKSPTADHPYESRHPSL